MPRFFTQNISDIHGKILGADAVHISRVLRMKVGEKLVVCDLDGYDYDCVITSFSPDEVEFDVLNKHISLCEPDVSVTLYMAFPKSDKFELIVQKCVELGVDKIVPVISARCIARPDDRSSAKKLERYSKIAYEAAKQCGRAKIPKIDDFVDFKTALQLAKQSELSMLFYEKGGQAVGDILSKKPNSIALFIGSEGGFEESEAKEAQKNGIHLAYLGPRILRCETAAITATATVMFATGNL